MLGGGLVLGSFHGLEEDDRHTLEQDLVEK